MTTAELLETVRRVKARTCCLCAILILFACVGCRSSLSKVDATISDVDLFPIVPPISDATPSARLAFPIRVPLTMVVVRHNDTLAVSFPDLETTNVTVGYKMVTGIAHEERLCYNAVTHLRGRSLLSGATFGDSTNLLTFGRDGIPTLGQEFVLEHQVTVFETDVPSQHMWSPQSGKHYRILWTRTFRENIQ